MACLPAAHTLVMPILPVLFSQVVVGKEGPWLLDHLGQHYGLQRDRACMIGDRWVLQVPASNVDNAGFG